MVKEELYKNINSPDDTIKLKKLSKKIKDKEAVLFNFLCDIRFYKPKLIVSAEEANDYQLLRIKKKEYLETFSVP